MSLQQHLLTLIWSNDPKLLKEESIKIGFDIRGINIYRRNLLANAQRALSITFPTIFKLLNSDVSENLVQQFLMLFPPTQGDWAQWGEEFPQFIAANQIAHDYSYLTDCAELDWHVHSALKGKDQTFDHRTLSLLGSAEPEALNIILNQNVTLIQTIFPIVDIFNAHHSPDQLRQETAMVEAKSALTTLMQLTTIPKQHTVMICRPDFQPKIVTLSNSEAEFMRCINTGKSLAESLNTVHHDQYFSFEKWLITALEQNLIDHFKENAL